MHYYYQDGKGPLAKERQKKSDEIVLDGSSVKAIQVAWDYKIKHYASVYSKNVEDYKVYISSDNEFIRVRIAGKVIVKELSDGKTEVRRLGDENLFTLHRGSYKVEKVEVAL